MEEFKICILKFSSVILDFLLRCVSSQTNTKDLPKQFSALFMLIISKSFFFFLVPETVYTGFIFIALLKSVRYASKKKLLHLLLTGKQLKFFPRDNCFIFLSSNVSLLFIYSYSFISSCSSYKYIELLISTPEVHCFPNM